MIPSGTRMRFHRVIGCTSPFGWLWLGLSCTVGLIDEPGLEFRCYLAATSTISTVSGKRSAYRTDANQRFHTPIAEPRYNLEGWYASTISPFVLRHFATAHFVGKFLWDRFGTVVSHL